MADRMTPEQRSRCMSRIRHQDTAPEMIVRRALHALGFRFRLHCPNLPGCPDLVLPKWKTAIFVHGCFWHGHNDCRLFRWPGSRTEYWRAKIGGNIERDYLVTGLLLAAGWRVVLIWECAIKRSCRLTPDEFKAKIAAVTHSAELMTEFRGRKALPPQLLRPFSHFSRPISLPSSIC